MVKRTQCRERPLWRSTISQKARTRSPGNPSSPLLGRRPGSAASHPIVFAIALVSIVLGIRHLTAQERLAADKPAREIFVPFDDLNVLLEGQTQRIFLTRKEYEELLAKARLTPPRLVPIAAAILAADYNAVAEEGRIKLSGKLEIEVLAEGLAALPLDLSGVGVRSALVDGQPASIGRGAGGRPMLFVSGPGRKQLTLELVAPLEASAAVQGLQFEVPVPASTRFKLSVPGNVEIKAGADVASRTVDAAAGVTRFEILPRRGKNHLVMSLNNKLLLQQRAVVARSVLVDEITSTHERLGATVSLGILHGAVDRFRFALPEGFEATELESPLLARWSVEAVNGKQMLDVFLREPTTDTVVLHLSAVRAAPPLVGWSFPKLVPQDVVGQVAVVGLLVEDRLKPQRLATEGLLPINIEDLAGALPPSLATRDARSALVRPFAAWYAPQAAYKLSAEFVDQPAALDVVSSILLELSDAGERVKGGFTLSPAGEKLFVVEFVAPPGWQVTEATGRRMGLPTRTAPSSRPGENPGPARTGQETHPAGIVKLPFETFSAGERGSRVQLRLPQGVAQGESYEVKFQAVSTAPGWLTAWTTRVTALPVFAVSGVKRDQGAVSIRALDDLEVRPDKLSGLTPLDDADRSRFGLAGIETNLAFRYEGHPYSATLIIERTLASVTARAFSFFRVSPEGLAADYELLFDVRNASTRRLIFRLPAGTPGEVSIRGLGETVVKETSSEVKEGERLWTVQLADKVQLAADEFGNRAGSARLAVRFDQPLAKTEPKDWKLPLIKASGVEYQSGLAAVEGSPDLDIEIKSHPRKADVGDLAAAEHQPGRRLLGVFGYLGEKEEVSINVARHAGYGLPAAIVERAELVTLVSASGMAQTAARYRLRSKALFLEVELPVNAELWSALLDGRPLSPQVADNKLLLSLPTGSADAVRDVQVVYQSPVAPFRMRGRIETAAPQLYLRADAESERREVPAADLIWYLHVPSGYKVVHSDGTVFNGEIARRKIPGSTALAAAGATMDGLARVTPTLIGNGDRMYAAKKSEQPAGIASFDFSGSMSEESTISEPKSHAATPPPMTSAPMSPRHGDFEGEKGQEKLPMPNADMPKAGEAPQPMSPEVTAKPAPVKEEPSPGEREPAAAPEPDPLTTPGTPAPPVVMEVTREIKNESKTRRDSYWALEGVRSLAIELRPDGQEYTFQSLGVEPQLSVTLVDARRFSYLAVGVALLVFVFGLKLTPAAWRVRLRYLVIVLLVAWVLPLVTGRWQELDDACDLAVCAALALFLYYMAASVYLWLTRRRTANIAPSPAVAAALVLVAMVAGSFATSPAYAQPKMPKDGPGIVVEPADAARTVAVPEDAVIIPYDVEAKDGIKNAEKLLVPYDKYVELWNRANPDQPRDKKLPPAPYALAGAAFDARLSGDDFLLVTGRLTLDVLAEGIVEIPLPFSGGVLSEATLDGKPARLRVVAAAPVAQGKKPSSDSPPPAESLLVLYASGVGRKQLSVTLRLPLTRQGGWRIAEGRLPAGTVAALTLRAPEANTEVRLAGVSDRRNYETKAANEAIETALDGGPLRVEWRPKVAAAEVDRSLTARSQARLDVREDGLRLVWHLALDFPRGRRESFVVSVPDGYLMERVSGTNVRGWQSKEEGKQIEVTLLKPATDVETLTLHLSRRGAIGQAGVTKLDAPFVSVEGAALQQGTLSIRRSEALDVRTLATTGVSRTDNSEPMPADAREAEEASPLPLRPYQSYRFSAVPFTVSLEAAPLAVNVSAEVQTLVQIAERETFLTSRLRFRAQEAAVHVVRLAIPRDLEIARLEAPGSPEWAVFDEGGQRVLAVYLPGGARGEFLVALSGSLGKRAMVDSLPLPNLNALGVVRQQGEIAVLADSALAVSSDELKNCESVLLERAHGWLSPAERELARLVLAYRIGDYTGALKLTKKTPRVTGYTITNVRATSRTIEETIFLEFNILDGGLRSFTFQLPERLKDARIRTRNLKQVTRKPVVGPGVKVNAKDADKLDAAMLPAVSVWLELQDEARGRFQVIVEHDRLRSEGVHEAPLTSLETGKIERRFVVLENASADELLIDGAHGFEALDRRQQGWQELAGILGENITSAYIAREHAELRRLAFHLKQRAAVETAAAKIGLAETRLVLDGSGAYRAAVVFRVNNRTEQFLEIELPSDAELWTARVAGAAVKPTGVPGAKSDRLVRLPLVKTEEGDDDYEVVLKYGGKLGNVSSWSAVKFPLLVSRNINVETSQVRLYLPETHAWFNFGGKMRYAASEADLQAGYLAYRTRQIEQLTQALSSGNKYSSMRAENNLKQLGQTLRTFSLGSISSGEGDYNEALQQQTEANSSAVAAAEVKIEAQKRQKETLDIQDNRGKLNTKWNLQTESGSGQREPIRESALVLSPDGRSVTSSTSNSTFNREWLGQNKLGDEKGKSAETWNDLSKVQKSKVAAGDTEGKKSGDGQPNQPGLSTLDAPKGEKDGPAAPGKPGLQKGLYEGEEREATERYQKRLEDQVRQQQTAQPAQQSGQRYGLGLGEQVEQARTLGRPKERDYRELGSQNVPNIRSDLDKAEDIRARGVPADDSYLASLDVEFPERGRVYRFTTPRGEVEVTAQALSAPLLSRLLRGSAVVGVVLAALFVVRLRRKAR